ncbi:hypothetical protein GCM10029976_065470 [Kribbella albertanoniae]
MVATGELESSERGCWGWGVLPVVFGWLCSPAPGPDSGVGPEPVGAPIKCSALRSAAGGIWQGDSDDRQLSAATAAPAVHAGLRLDGVPACGLGWIRVTFRCADRNSVSGGDGV